MIASFGDHALLMLNQSIDSIEIFGIIPLSLLLHHFLYGSDELGIMTGDVILWRIIHLDVWIEGGVLAEGATHVAATYLWNTEYQAAVHQGLPPYGSHCTSHRCTNQLTDAQLLIYPWETMTVAVVVLADQIRRMAWSTC